MKAHSLITQVYFMIFGVLVVDENVIKVQRHTFSMKGRKIWVITWMKKLSALVSPNGMTNHIQPSFILKAVYHSSPSII